LGRRRRRVVRIVKKKLPTVFVCPRCGEEAVRVTIAKDTGKATVMCALCQLKDEFQAHPAAQMIDVYSFFADRFYGVKEPRAIIPHERESKMVPKEEEPSEPEPLEAPAIEPEQHAEQAEPETAPPEQTLDTTMAAKNQTETAASEVTPQKSTPEGEQAVSGASAEKPPEEEEEPFADILGTKDKKRYSANPVPDQQSEQTSQA
jgi:transcription elongation factor Elf1